MTTADTVSYTIDPHDRIARVSASWDPFARANLGLHVESWRVVGQPLWEFITNATTRQVYRELVARVRDGHEFFFGFRCDAPDLRRFMEMRMAPEPGGSVMFASRTVREEPRAPQPLLDAGRYHSRDTLTMCGWCKKMPVAGKWAEVEEAVARLRLFDAPRLPDLSHGMCPECFTHMKAALAVAS